VFRVAELQRLELTIRQVSLCIPLLSIVIDRRNVVPSAGRQDILKVGLSVLWVSDLTKMYDSMFVSLDPPETPYCWNET
jgi:hypothetical protein